MNLFFAYVLAVCPALNALICAAVVVCLMLTLFLLFCCSQAEPDGEEYTRCKNAAWWLLKCFLILGLLWVLVPSQKQLNAMMLNYQATYETRDEYGGRK